MPATLGHIGVQTLLTRGLLRRADIKWIWFACVLPDLPWIWQRVLRALAPDLAPIDLRLYAVVQSALVFCVVLSAALACLSRRPRATFAILAGGSLLHLVLDAMQTKWANGVVLFAPVHWNFVNFGWFWPDDPATLLLLGLGAVVGLREIVTTARGSVPSRGGRGRRRPGAAAAFLAIYLLAPVLFVGAAEEANLHHAKLLRPGAERVGRPVEFDRAQVDVIAGRAILSAWTREDFELRGVSDLPDSATVSIRGRFVDTRTIRVAAHHIHPAGLRDMASYAGLGLVVLLWALCLWRERGGPMRGG